MSEATASSRVRKLRETVKASGGKFITVSLHANVIQMMNDAIKRSNGQFKTVSDFIRSAVMNQCLGASSSGSDLLSDESAGMMDYLQELTGLDKKEIIIQSLTQFAEVKEREYHD